MNEPIALSIFHDAPPPERQLGLDRVRGIVMLLMVIDHVRVFAGVPAGGITPALFFTRWVTHFCAPAFVFFAGTSAYLYGAKHRDLTKFLVTRGLWLIALELTVLRFFWTFNGDFAHHAMAGVIWAIGWSLIALAAFARLPWKWNVALGLAVIGLHNLVGPMLAQRWDELENPGRALWQIAYRAFALGPIPFNGPDSGFWVLYSLVPWISVMALGYSFGRIVTFDEPRRRRILFAIGLGVTALFVALRAFDAYGDPSSWRALAAGNDRRPPMPALLAFLNTAKYPASLDFLLMTLGPAIAVLPWLDRLRGRLGEILAVFGRVPFFFYLLHIPLIHLMAMGVSLARTGAVDPWLFGNHPMAPPQLPDGYTWSLPLLYAVGVGASVVLYFACRWFAGVKRTSANPLLKYF
jgi:uncharacterized membrane protein